MLALQQSDFAALVRASPWLYPLANVVHVLALLLFFAAVAAMDARLLGAFRAVPVAAVLRPCQRLAAAALAVQAASGVMLLAPEAKDLGNNPAFLSKLLLIGIALTNAALLRAVWGRRLHRLAAALPAPLGARACAAVSLAAWLGVAALGRIIAYV